MIKPAITLTLFGLTACATTTPPFDDDGNPNVRDQAETCDAAAAQGMIGERATSALGGELQALTGARTLRWVPPRTAVTMDYRMDRLTVSYDDDMRIGRIACG